MVGYASPGSLAGRLIAGQKRVWLFGQDYDVLAEVQSIKSMSAHGDYEDLLQFLSVQNPEKVKRVFLVHGEYDVQQKFAQRIVNAGFKNVSIPEYHQEFEL
ncbi:RNA-metabolising metallo-beta-lactamase [compost metagenome]